jgi:hypothetical protein
MWRYYFYIINGHVQRAQQNKPLRPLRKRCALGVKHFVTLATLFHYRLCPGIDNNMVPLQFIQG